MFSNQSNGFSNMLNQTPGNLPMQKNPYVSNPYNVNQGYSYPQNYGQQAPAYNSSGNGLFPAQNFKNGGSVKQMARKVREHGRNGDTVLAHINPMEQEILKSYGGSGDINPETGLPEYGFKLGKFIKHAARIVVPAIASMYGGPAGAVAASALLGASERGGGNKMKGALAGAGRGAAYAALAPMVGGAFGVNPSGMFGSAMGMNAPSFLGQLGMTGAPMAGGGLGIFGNAGQTGIASKMMDSLGGVSGSGDGGGILSGLGGSGGLGLGLGLAGIGTSLLGREKKEKQESIEDYVNKNTPNNMKPYMPKRIKPINQQYIPRPEDHRGPRYAGEHQYYDNVMPEYEFYSHGGSVDGYSGGQEDNVKALLSPGEYVMNATATSRLGDGNTNAGFRKWKKIESAIMRDGAGSKLPKKSKSVDSLLKIARRA